MRLKKHAKRLLPKFILRRIVARRRLQNGKKLTRRHLITLAEKKRQYDEFMRLWISRRDQLSRAKAQTMLLDMHGIIRWLASGEDWAFSKASVRKMQIPGWRKSAANKSRRR